MHLGLSGFDGESIIQAMDARGIRQCWLLTWEELHPPVEELNMGLPPAPILEMVQRYPDRLVPFYAPDPGRKKLREHFEKYIRLGIRGCGELKVSRKWKDPEIGRYLALVEEFSLPLVFHMEHPRKQYIQEKEGRMEWVLERVMNDKFNGMSRYYLTRVARSTGILQKKIERNQVEFPGILDDFDGLEQRIREFPGIRFIAHGPDFWNHISDRLHPRYIHQKGPYKQFGVIDRMLEEYPNLYCDISGHSGYNALKRAPARSRLFLEKHIAKVLFGTDNTRLPLRELLGSLKLGRENMERILWKNASELLDLPASTNFKLP